MKVLLRGLLSYETLAIRLAGHVSIMVPPSVQRIDKFDVLRRIGRGGMGSVFLARDPDMDRLVAIKLLNDGFDDADLRGRFVTEARSASALRHPNIVTIFQTGAFLGRPFLVMEYVEGETFADIIASGRAVALGESRRRGTGRSSTHPARR